jgi:hypothetical protein
VSTFVELCALPTPGVAILVDVSTDKFATVLTVSGVQQRWSTVPGFFNLPSNNYFNGGISSVGRHQRALGTEGLPAASTISLILDNTDGAFDWLTYPFTVETTVFKSRFRVYVAVFDPANPSDNQVQALGTFQPLDMPSRDESRVYLELADDVMGEAADLTLSPSLNSWLKNASTNNANTPWAASSGVLGASVEFAVDPDRPLPLAFGNGRVPMLRLVRGDLRYHPFAVCCTTNTGLTATSPDSGLIGLTFQNFANVPLNAGLFFWDRSPFTITRDGRNWRIWLVQFDTVGMLNSSWVMNDVLAGEFGGPGSNGTAVGFRKAFADAFFSKVGQMYATAFPLSSHTYPPVPTGGTIGAAALTSAITCVNVARDLLQQYCRTGVVVETTSFDAVSAASPASRASVYVGDVGSRATRKAEPTIVGEAGQIRGILRGLSQAGNFDLTTLSAGQVRAIASTATSTAYLAAAGAALFRFDETRVVADSLRMRTPSQGQRWAPYNRVFLEIGESSGWLAPGRHGPFDHTANLAAWGRPFTRLIDATYADVSQELGDAFKDSGVGFATVERQFPVESKIRPVVSFRYGLEALQLELGDYFTMSLTRGGQTTLVDTYTDAIWKVEALNFLPETGQVEVEGVWSSDILTEIPFLLDDDASILRVDSSTLVASVTTAVGSDVATFSAGSLLTAGVVVGDILVLQNAAEATDVFNLNRGNRITAVTATTATGAAKWQAVGPTSTWKIIKGSTTTPATPAGRQFGKAADSKTAGVFSSAADANRLREG